jgi:hypothetical protein
VKNLANVLEYVRPKIKEQVLWKKDEAALFTIANEFDIRHNEGSSMERLNNQIMTIKYS